MASFASGPSGGSGGTNFSDAVDLPPRAPVAVIEVRAGDVVDAVRTTYRQRAGDLRTQWHGGSGGALKRLELRPGEYIRRVRGTYGLTIGWGHVILSLAIDTNQRSRALAAGGSHAGAPFTYEAGRNLEIAGFTGRSGAVLDALGVLYRTRAGSGKDGLAVAGPTGGGGGRRFSDASTLGSTPGLAVSVVTARGDRFLDSITMQYATPAGDILRGRRHGGSGGVAQELRLERGEYITRISGTYGTLLDRLIIDTNRRADALDVGGHVRPLEPRSPFGGRYEYQAPQGLEIAGFVGSSATFVDALGVIYRPRVSL